MRCTGIGGGRRGGDRGSPAVGERRPPTESTDLAGGLELSSWYSSGPRNGVAELVASLRVFSRKTLSSPPPPRRPTVPPSHRPTALPLAWPVPLAPRPTSPRRDGKVGLLKGLVVVTEHPPDSLSSKYVDMRLLRVPHTYCCRLYVVKGLHLQPKDPNGLADPYLRCKVGRPTLARVLARRSKAPRPRIGRANGPARVSAFCLASRAWPPSAPVGNACLAKSLTVVLCTGSDGLRR